MLWNCSISHSRRTKTSHPTPLCLVCLCLALCCIVFRTHGKPLLLRQLVVVVVGSGHICQLPGHPLWRIALKRGETVRQLGTGASPRQMSNTATFVLLTWGGKQHSLIVIWHTKELLVFPQVVKTMVHEMKYNIQKS